MIEVWRYQCPDGAVPVSRWLAGDVRARAKLEIRFARLAVGVFGDAKPVGEGVLELREATGPGHRVYYGRHGAAVVLLLCGGDKRTQDDDVQRAKRYWQDWKRRNT